MFKLCAKKIIFIMLVIALLFSISSPVLATSQINPDTNEETASNVESNTTLEVVENNICHIEVGDIGEFNKQITAYDETEKSVTLTLTFRNIKEIEESYRNVEIFFVIDNSSSMTEAFVGEGTRKAEVMQSAKSLTEKLFTSNPNVKIGVVGFSSLDTAKGETEGTINDAKLMVGLSNSKFDVSQAITSLENTETGPRTNIEAGLTLAEQNFSNSEGVDRYIVLLTDGVPNNATDGTYATYGGVVATRTRNKIEEIKSSGTKIIGAMINLPAETIEPTTQKTYRELSEEIFGTIEQPLADVFYYVSDEQIESTIVNDIYDDLKVVTDNTLKNITIVDYFPQEIIDNFDFEYVASPNIGTVSQEIDRTNNSITWHIEMLSAGEEASLSYKLILKEDFNKEIIDKILPTNENVDITAEDDNTRYEESSDVSPTVVVKEDVVEPEPTPEPDKPITDNTVSDKPIPQTGDNSILFVVAISILSIAIIARFIYIRNK